VTRYRAYLDKCVPGDFNNPVRSVVVAIFCATQLVNAARFYSHLYREQHSNNMPTSQVCVNPRSSALNMTLPAFAAERRRLQLMPPVRPQLSIDVSCPPDAQQQTHQPPLLLSIDGTDRRTNERTDALPLHRPFSA